MYVDIFVKSLYIYPVTTLRSNSGARCLFNRKPVTALSYILLKYDEQEYMMSCAGSHQASFRQLND